MIDEAWKDVVLLTPDGEERRVHDLLGAPSVFVLVRYFG